MIVSLHFLSFLTYTILFQISKLGISSVSKSMYGTSSIKVNISSDMSKSSRLKEGVSRNSPMSNIF